MAICFRTSTDVSRSQQWSKCASCKPSASAQWKIFEQQRPSQAHRVTVCASKGESMRSTSLLSFVLASAAFVGLAHAQPDVRDHRPQREERRLPPPAGNGPPVAPPSPRVEHHAARAGFVWIPGGGGGGGGGGGAAGRGGRGRAGRQW